MDLDVVGYWCHRIVYLSAMVHIKYGERDGDWDVMIEKCKSYLEYVAPRYRIYSKLCLLLWMGCSEE
jgi:hypothetical protein